MVECTALEMRHRCKPIGGSNPSLSATRAEKSLHVSVRPSGDDARRIRYAKEFHVGRYLRETMIPRIAPVSPQLALSFIAEKTLGLAKSC